MPESFLYFAYGSNMYTKRLVRRVGKVEKVAIAYVLGRRLSFDKISDDGSAKCDCAPSKDKDERVYGAVFRIDGGRRADLDRAEGLGRGYFADYITVYSAQKEDEKKSDWHMQSVRAYLMY